MKQSIRIIFLTILALAIIGYSAPVPFSYATEPPVVVEKIEQWAVIHPRAATDLGDWVKSYKESSKAIFKWDCNHPEQTKTFVTWVVSHLGKSSDIFIEEHKDWRRLNRIVETHREALNAFTVWCRFHPKAATELMKHTGALNWAGQHLYNS